MSGSRSGRLTSTAAMTFAADHDRIAAIAFGCGEEVRDTLLSPLGVTVSDCPEKSRNSVAATGTNASLADAAPFAAGDGLPPIEQGVLTASAPLFERNRLGLIVWSPSRAAHPDAEVVAARIYIVPLAPLQFIQQSERGGSQPLLPPPFEGFGRHRSAGRCHDLADVLSGRRRDFIVSRGRLKTAQFSDVPAQPAIGVDEGCAVAA